MIAVTRFSIASRLGRTARYFRAYVFSASLHAWTFGSFQSSSQRYCSVTESPWWVSVTGTVSAAGGTSMTV